MTPQPIRLVAPAVIPVTLAEVKAQCNYFESDQDALLVGYIRSAVEMAEAETSLGLITQTWQQSFRTFPSKATQSLTLYRKPIQAITDISYLDSSGAVATLGSSIYRVNGIGADRTFGYVQLASGAAWPTAISAAEAITVTYMVGFGDDWNSVPEMIRQAIKVAVATWFNFREEVVMGTTVAELPWSSRALLRYWRSVAIA